MFKRRIGPDPHEGGRKTPASPATNACPDIWELENGDFAVIGRLARDTLIEHLPESAFCAPEESIVIIPRETLTRARSDIPEE